MAVATNGAGGRTRTGTAISHRGIFIPATAFAASPGRVRAFGSFVVWTIPSPWRVRALGAARLVSTPSRRSFDRGAWLGIACYRFPRIWAVLLLRFPGGHSICSSPLRLPVPPRPHYRQSSDQRSDRQGKGQRRGFRLFPLNFRNEGERFGADFARPRRGARDRRTLRFEASTMFLMCEA
jgi:hypothetical protein